MPWSESWTEDDWKNYAGQMAQQYAPDVYKMWSNSSFFGAAPDQGPGGWQDWVTSNYENLGFDLPQGYTLDTGQGDVPESNPNVFGFPDDIFPYGQSYAGLPGGFGEQLAGYLMPYIQNMVSNPTGAYNDIFNNSLQGAQSTYLNTLNRSLSQSVPRVVNNLANRGILSSTDAQDVISNAISNTATNTASQIYSPLIGSSTSLANAYGNNLASLLAMSRINTSYNEDQTAMYQIIASILQGTQ